VILLWNDIILELYSLVRNMIWLDDYAWIWHWHGCGFKPWRTQIKLIFCYFWFWLEFEGLKETLADMAAKSGCKTVNNETMNGH